AGDGRRAPDRCRSRVRWLFKRQPNQIAAMDELLRGTRLTLYGYVLHKSPITARVHIDIANALLGNHHVRLIPKREHRHVAANDFLCLRIERSGPGMIVNVRSFVENLVEIRIAVATAVARRACLSRDLSSGEEIVIKDRILISAN